jgi:hypothetical protein
MKNYSEPSTEEIMAYLSHNCEASGHTLEACELACPWCSEVHGWDGYCADTECPNYKGGAALEYICQCYKLPESERLTGHHPNCPQWDHRAYYEEEQQ